jgi:hypothetical protein
MAVATAREQDLLNTSLFFYHDFTSVVFLLEDWHTGICSLNPVEVVPLDNIRYISTYDK